MEMMKDFSYLKLKNWQHIQRYHPKATQVTLLNALFQKFDYYYTILMSPGKSLPTDPPLNFHNSIHLPAPTSSPKVVWAPKKFP